MEEARRGIIRELDESIEVKEKLKSQSETIRLIAGAVARALRVGGEVVLFGNGGSAADAQHIAAEFVGRFQRERGGLPALALTTNTSSLTAISNDFSFSEVFSRQVEALVRKNDVVIGISTSGNSENVIRGVASAKKKGAFTIALTGEDGGRLARSVDLVLKVPSKNTQRIQESHITVGHIICGIVESELFPQNQ